MKDTEQAKAYLKRDPLRYMDMLQPLERGEAEVVALREDGVLLYEVPGQLYLLAADSLEAGQALCAGIETMRLAATHDQATGAYLRQRYGREKCQPCTQAAYLGRDPFPLPPGLDIRQLGEEYLPAVVEHYHAFSDPDYIRRRLAAGVMHGAFQNGELAGFIGMHAEGSVGMLEVFPPYRRRGIAAGLMAFQANWVLGRGWVPFSQIWEGNEASFALHRRLGWSLCPSPMYWVMDS